MGGRGGASGMSRGTSRSATRGNGSKDGTLLNVQPQEITTTAYLSGSRSAYGGRTTYKDEILTAETDGNGNLTFSYARPDRYPTPSAKTNKTADATFTIAHGAVNGKLVGIDMDKVNSIKGQTYNLRDLAKSAGFKWDGSTKSWKRKK